MNQNDQTGVNTDDEIEAQISWEPSIVFFRLAIYALLVGAAVTLLVIRILAPDQPIRIIGPAMVSVLALAGWYLLARGNIRSAVTLMAWGGWTSVAVISIFTGG
ncbi:MAG: hypothetical protein JNK59_12740, partial [Sterolibacteriaceae bacterium]|nr:hypothetical protein [Sterolibacteriaceae bacterium]